MIDIHHYPRLEMLRRSSSDLTNAINVLFQIYDKKKRLSGRFVTDHCLESAEIVSHYTINPIYLISAIFHDTREDLKLSFVDVKGISGQNGEKIARNVTVLTKRADLQNRQKRNREYMERIFKAIVLEDPWIGLVKLADRLSNLMDIQYHEAEKIQFIVTQTLYFYVPIAFRLGLRRLSNKLVAYSIPHIGSGP